MKSIKIKIIQREIENQCEIKLHDLIGKGYYINLRHRYDKNKVMLRQLSKLNLISIISRLDGVYPKDLGYTPNKNGKFEIIEYSTAAATAHINAIKLAKQNNYENVLVLEDDALFSKNGLKNLIEALIQLQNKNWDVLYIGGDCRDKFEFHGKNLVKIKNIMCSHAYIVNKNFYDTILNEKKIIQHFDVFLNEYAKEKYLVNPLSIIQKLVNKTDIGETTFTPDLRYWAKTYSNK
jgi:hypothetical protein